MGMLPDCLTNGMDMMSELEQQEMRILQEVLRRSKEEYELEMVRRTGPKEGLGSASTSSLVRVVQDRTEQQGTPPAHPPNTHKVEVKSSSQLQLPTLNNATSAMVSSAAGEREKEDPGSRSGESVQKSAAVSTPASARVLPGRASVDTKVSPAVRAPVKGPGSSSSVERSRGARSGGQATEAWLEEASREAGISQPFTELSVAQQEQLQQRALYLRQQRDKLQALKKEQRPTPEGDTSNRSITANGVAAERDTSNRSITANGVAADRVNGSQTGGVPLVAQNKKDVTAEEKKRLQKRKHLAEKLREEVIKK
ncbi:hypothetical protein SKAU_G00167920 [Synaphobranchus kaupii]|uniref:Uncharacterized protein n=1 Tax=Synaphobranchus kaupii TaxID=118154 RepID=A0A9Q1FKB6_SYNKA|nr:hypothetical protein SKAU_G00167920 [Synaphobranchus kaupii]